MKLNPTFLSFEDTHFINDLDKALAYEADYDSEIDHRVKSIISDIRMRGDAALIDFTKQFDGFEVGVAAELKVTQAQMLSAYERISEEARSSLALAIERVREYHEQQRQDDWSFEDTLGNRLGQKITPLDSVGVYVPGGKAAYPSSVIMNVVPAQVAGVDRIVMVVPTPQGHLNDMVLSAAYLLGLDDVYTIGGAQAVAALAYGTETIKAVDKIVGPGNIYVATAKKLVFGKVGIDMIAGPSEILVAADASVPSEWVAKDLFSQAEHDEDAQAILVTTDQTYAEEVLATMNRLFEALIRQDVVEASINRRGIIVVCSNKTQALEVINRVAPEHLELCLQDAEDWVSGVRHAGAIFVGRYASEALGDYCAGPNHVLPTSGTARFSSPLGVYDFQKKSSVLNISADGANELGKVAGILADLEGLQAHGLSARARMKDE